MRDAFICDFARTPIGRYGGALSSSAHRRPRRAPDPGSARRAIHRGLGRASTKSSWAAPTRPARTTATWPAWPSCSPGLPTSVPGTTLNRLCGSGLDAVGTAARAIKTGEADLIVAGGVESMTRAPFVMGKATEAFQRQAEIHDTTIGWRFVNPLMKAQYGIDSMPETGENVAEEFQVSRADQDAFALRSQQRAEKAQESGFFAREITPVTIKTRKGDTVVEQGRASSPRYHDEMLAKLKTPFRDPGTVTAGNASGVNDGAAALIVASEEAAQAPRPDPARQDRRHGDGRGRRPASWASVPFRPRRSCWQQTGRTLSDDRHDRTERGLRLPRLAVLRQLGLPEDGEQVNPHGGAIALGHPLGMSGARLALTAVNALETLGLKERRRDDVHRGRPGNRDADRAGVRRQRPRDRLSFFRASVEGVMPPYSRSRRRPLGEEPLRARARRISRPRKGFLATANAMTKR